MRSKRTEMNDLAEKPAKSEMSKIGTPEKTSGTVCQQCFEMLDLDDNFCRHCGGMTEVGAAMVKIGRLPAPAAAAVPEKPLRWTESPVIVLLALSLFGPLAIRMLWRSRRFARGWKIGLTLAVLAITVFACWYTARVFNEAVDQAWRQAGLL
jgi:hypothetical protein